MNDLPTHSNDDGELQVRPQSQQPPIQWPTRDETREKNDRERAAAIARQRVERTYEAHGEHNTTNALNKTESAQQTQQHTQPIQQQRTMREEPYNWDQYHTAWQQYYHQYFYRYYAGWWQQQKEQLPAQNTAAQTSDVQTPETPLSVQDERKRVAAELREKVRSHVETRAKKVKSSNHFKPIMASLTVGLLFLFFNYNQVIVGAVKQYIAPGSVVTTPVIVESNAQATIGPEPKIIIPKIGVDVPVVYDEPNVDEASYQKALERGVVHLGNTANPGTKGNVVIGGHSSNNVFNPGKYKYVFVNLKQLDVGDVFYLNYEGKRFTYKVTLAKHIISPTDTSVLAQTEKPTVTLFTCDPPGTNINRLIVQGEQIDPSPDAAPKSEQKETVVNKSNPLPSVAPSIWDRILNIF
jgi:sortase A